MAKKKDTNEIPAPGATETLKVKAKPAVKKAAALKAEKPKVQPKKKTEEPAPAKEEVQPTYVSLPDPALAGPPFKFDGNSLCQNPIVSTLRLSAGVIVHLAVCEREKTWFGCSRVDYPGDKKKEAHSAGTVYPFGGFDSSFGFRTQAQAIYEAARDALTAMQMEFGANPTKAAKEVLFEAENAVKALIPPSAKLVAAEGGLIGYRPQESARYLEVFSKFATTHDTGVIFPQEMTRDEARDFGLGMAHIARTSKWTMADWYLFCAKQYPDLLDAMLTEGNRQTIHNEAQVAKRFAPDERFKDLSFTHHQEVAFVEDRGKRAALLGTALAEGLSVKKLRELVKGGVPALPPASPPQGSSTTTATGDKTPAVAPQAPSAVTTPPDDELPFGGAVAAREPGEFEEGDPAPEQTAEEKTLADYDKLMEHLDEAQTLVRRGACNPEHVKARQIKEIRLIVEQIADALEALVAA